MFFCSFCRSVISCPIGTVVDWDHNCFSMATLLSTTRKDPWHRRLLDCAATTFLRTFVILSWHGGWSMEDAIMEGNGILEMPMRQQAWVSFGIGLASAAATFVAQFHALRFAQSNKVFHFPKTHQ